MKQNALVLAAIGWGLSLAASSGHAHHNFMTIFDAEKPLKLVGTVTKVEWQNPHARLYIDVEDDSGDATNWSLELASPNLLMRAGWTRTAVKVGDAVTVEGYQARDGSNVGNAHMIILNSTGERVLGGRRTAR